MMFRYDLDDPKSYPFLLIWYGQPTAKARAFGLDVWLPDGYDDQDYRSSWRDELRGRIAMTDEELDEIFDFRVVRLKDYGNGTELRFDIRNGVMFHCSVGNLHRVVRMIREVADETGLPISPENESDGMAFGSLRRYRRDLKRAAAQYIRDAGHFVPDKESEIEWILKG